MRAAVIVVRAASSVPKPPGHRGRRADFQRISENVLLTSRGRVIHLYFPALSRGGALARPGQGDEEAHTEDGEIGVWVHA